MTTVHPVGGRPHHFATSRWTSVIGAVLACLLGAARVASAATYYLHTDNGSDSNPGTTSAPWKTLAKVQASAGSGDTIVIQSADATTYATKWPTQVSYRAKVLRQLAVTWTFDTDYPVGQFANGDFWVGGPVKIVGIDPPSVPLSGRTMNGSMVNPIAGWDAKQGYDSAMPANAYEASLNVALGVSGASPLALAAHSSLISTISVAAAGAIPQMERAVILTVLPSPAAPDSFRPPYCGADKTIRFHKSALDYSLLKKLTPVAGTPALAAVEAQFAAPWLEHQGGWGATGLRPKLNMPNYGREMHTAIGTAALMLHLDFPDQQKEKLLVEFVQLGLDLYGVVAAGGTANWANDGGHAGGRKWPILFAGLMLNDPDLKAIGVKSGAYLFQNGYGPGRSPPDYIHFGEDDQTAYVTQADVDITHGPTWKPDARDAQHVPYDTTDIGLPEWGIRHATHPELNNKWLPTEYRGVAGPPFHGTALAALLMEGAKALWNHNAYFDYTDRYMIMTAPGGEYAGWWRSMSGFTANMWDTYRVQVGPVWPATAAVGPTLSPLGDQQLTVGQILTLIVKGTGPSVSDLTYSASGLPVGATFSGQTFTWTPSAAQVGAYKVTFTVDDGKYQDSQTITITVTKGNSVPVLGALDNRAVNENQSLTFVLSATDADGDALTYAAGNLPAGATCSGQTVAVSVDAADTAGNVMSECQYAFTTQMRVFGRNTPVSTLGGNADGRAATICDPAGAEQSLIGMQGRAGSPA